MSVFHKRISSVFLPLFFIWPSLEYNEKTNWWLKLVIGIIMMKFSSENFTITKHVTSLHIFDFAHSIDSCSSCGIYSICKWSIEWEKSVCVCERKTPNEIHGTKGQVYKWVNDSIFWMKTQRKLESWLNGAAQIWSIWLNYTSCRKIAKR